MAFTTRHARPWLGYLFALLAFAGAVAALPAPAPAPPPPVQARAASAKKPAPTTLGPPAPHFVAYSDESQFGIPAAADLQGFNTLILSFLLASGPADQAQAWTQLTSAQRATLKAGYKAQGITLLVSAFGSTESPTTDGKDPAALATSMAGWVRAWGMDGIDVDYEDFKAVAQGTAVGWLKTFTTVLREHLPAGQFVLTHAPVAPWFAPSQPYALVDAAVGSLIDWYNVQFYSQGTAYTTCATLVASSGDPFPHTSVLEIVRGGVPAAKVVLGKPGTPADAGSPSPSGGGGGTQEAGGGTLEAGGGTQVAGGGTLEAGGGTQVAGGGTLEAGGSGPRRRDDPHSNGFLETQTLAQCLVQAKAQGWNGGVMVWEFPDANAGWIKNVRALTWPVKKS